mgnify:CR=1 FL=1
MKKVTSEKKVVLFVPVLIASNTAFYILGKAMANSGEKELFSVPLIIAIVLSLISGVFSVFRKNKI